MNGHRHLHPDDDRVYACPHCDHAPIHVRKQDNTVIDPDKEFVCYECRKGFDEPVSRQSRESSGIVKQAGSRSAKHGPAVILEEMTINEFDQKIAELKSV